MHAGPGHAADAPGKNRLRGGRDHHAQHRGRKLVDPRFWFRADCQPAGAGRASSAPARQNPAFHDGWTSPLAELADYRVVIPAPSLQASEEVRGLMSVQPLGTLFEQSLLILCDSLIVELMQRSGIGAAQMLERHANLE